MRGLKQHFKLKSRIYGADGFLILGELLFSRKVKLAITQLTSFFAIAPQD